MSDTRTVPDPWKMTDGVVPGRPGPAGPPRDGDGGPRGTPAHRISRQRVWVHLVAGIVLFVGGLSVIGVASAHVDWLAANGIQTPATVVGTDPQCDGEFTPHVRVAFEALSGRHVTLNLAMGDSSCSSFVVGRTTSVYVDPADPTDAELTDGNADIGVPGWIGLGLMLWGLGSCCTGIARAWTNRRRRRAAWRAAADHPVDGTSTEWSRRVGPTPTVRPVGPGDPAGGVTTSPL